MNASHPLANGLVFAGLGELAGSTRYHDSSVWGNHGTTSGMETSAWSFSDSLQRKQLSFDGFDDYLDTSCNIAFGDFTVSCWVLAAASGNVEFDRIFDKLYDTGFWLGLGTSGNVKGGIRQSSAPYGLSCAMSWGEWHHVSMSRYGSTQTIIVDGGLATASQSCSSTAISTSYAVRIGRTAGATTNMIDAKIADPIIHSRALIASEVLALANPSNVMLSGLILPPRRKWWPVVAGGGGSGALTGSAAIVTTATGTLSGTGALSGSATITTSDSGTLSGTGALTGTATLATSCTGTLSGGTTLSGTAALTTSVTGTLTGTGSLASSAAVAVTPAGTLSDASSFSGSTSVAVGCTGTLSGFGALTGSVAMVLAATGTATDANVTVTGGVVMYSAVDNRPLYSAKDNRPFFTARV